MSELKTTSLSHKDNNTGTPNITMYSDGTTSLPGTALGGFRNQIINGNFHIHQRGSTGAAVAGFQTADHWRINGNRASIINNGPNGITNSLQSLTAGDTLSIRQPIELPLRVGDNASNGPFLEGTTWTLSFIAQDSGGSGGTVDANLSWSDGSSSSGSIAHTAAAQQNLTGTYTKFTFTVEIASSPTASNRCLNCNIILAGTGQPRLTNVQLEPGPVATPFEHRPIGTEFALCQRYYQTLTRARLYPASPDTTSPNRFYELPRTVTMRVKPTETQTSTTSTITFPQSSASIIGMTAAAASPTSGAVATNYTADAEL